MAAEDEGARVVATLHGHRLGLVHVVEARPDLPPDLQDVAVPQPTLYGSHKASGRVRWRTWHLDDLDCPALFADKRCIRKRPANIYTHAIGGSYACLCKKKATSV